MPMLRRRFSRRIVVFLIAVVFCVFSLFGGLCAGLSEGTSINSEIRKEFSELHHEGESPAILMFHGFGGSPLDMKPLADALREEGIAFQAIVLPGHGTTPEDLKETKMNEWLTASLNAYDGMKKRYDEIHIVGFSMGGSLALYVASERGVAKLVLISPYFRVKERWYYFGSVETWARRLSGIIPYIKKPKVGQINDPDGLRRYAAYESLPMKTIGELAKLGKLAREKAQQVKCKMLWLHSEGDIVTDVELSREVFSSVAASEKRFITYKRSNHILLYDYDSEDAIRNIISFLEDGPNQ